MYNLKNLQSIVVKKSDKGSIGIVSDKKDYPMEREKRLSCKKTLLWSLFPH